MKIKYFFDKLLFKLHSPPLVHRFFNKVNLSKVFIIFTFGLVTRVLVNYFYDVNVFTDYTTYISLSYYTGMAFFISFINDLPKINWNVLNISVVRRAIYSLISIKSEEMTLKNVGFKSSPNSISNDKLKVSDTLFMGDKNGKNRGGASEVGHRWPYAGLQGLYGNRSGTRPQLSAAAQGLYGDRGGTHLHSSSTVSQDGKYKSNQENKFKYITEDKRKIYISKPMNPQGSTLYKMNTFPVGSRSTSIGSKLPDSLNINASNRNFNTPSAPLMSNLTTPSTNIPVGYRSSASSNSTDLAQAELDYPNPETLKSRKSRLCSPVNTVFPPCFQDNSDSTNYVANAPLMSRLVTPSTMSPLFPSSSSIANNNIHSDNFPRPSNITYTRTAPSSIYTSDAENWYRSGEGYDRNSSNNDTVDTNRATVAITDPDACDVDFALRRRRIMEGIIKKEGLLSSTEEVILPVEGTCKKPKLGFKFINSKYHSNKSKLETIYLKYSDKTKGRLYWTLWEKKKNNFSSYREFKQFWSDSKVCRDINKTLGYNIKKMIDEMVQIRDPFNKH